MFAIVTAEMESRSDSITLARTNFLPNANLMRQKRFHFLIGVILLGGGLYNYIRLCYSDFVCYFIIKISITQHNLWIIGCNEGGNYSANVLVTITEIDAKPERQKGAVAATSLACKTMALQPK